ncbi:hypothetical protein A3C98_03625 [Candidatus Roizmanbacteria bacterium RIFCSPHIGHO2_02_FULL_37_15]|nr:MAG: hypothetical protein A2859_05105 [Candidatus Roizmanbacteria bacterium RIFCSPHIGHO2_01_FULL_37_16b]OGK20459.1 MAG: hypothetical protein A3C98_03625 [Candidatus Roizmanbacteria bacterium RIFCSPHIGHO2_02_FULL_37_15]OGK31726.1 MAG: hypothetical protein A3F57_00035 [Candidatus Roizmanbacteria bacterium RIFCSPHIGHO2_12_FULL_36_11]
MKKKEIVVDYPSLLLMTLKRRYLSLVIGFTTLVIIIASGLWFFTSKLKLVIPSKPKIKKEKLEPKTTRLNEEAQTYIVKEGDELYLIAEKFYGSGLNFQDIVKANNISNPDLLEVGQQLIIPKVKSKYPTAGEVSGTAAKTKKVTIRQDKYVIKVGDTLADIALQAYGDSYAWKKIATANNINDPDNLEVGKTLIIPR